MGSQGRGDSRQTWPITLDGSALVVELLPYAGRLWGTPESFRVDEVEQKLELRAGLRLLLAADPEGNFLEFLQYEDIDAYRSRK